MVERDASSREKLSARRFVEMLALSLAQGTILAG